MIHRYAGIYTSEIIIPENYIIHSIPENIEHKGNVMNYSFQCSINENKIQVKATYEFTKDIFQPEEYTELKESYAQVIKLFNNEIQLKAK